MPHIVYLAGNIVCPWPDCDFRIELIDFKLELMGNTEFYAEVVAAWGRKDGFGLVGRCPACLQYVLFGLTGKTKIDDPQSANCPVLPLDWHKTAFVA